MTAPLTPEQVADVLDDAADYIEAHGWVRHAIERDGRVCALGAISRVGGHDGYPATVSVLDAMRSAIGSPESIGCWNDRCGRTKQEVLDAFRAAAKQQRGRSPA